MMLSLIILLCFAFLEINATGFNYQNEDEKVTLSFPSTLQKGTQGLHLALLFKHYSTVIAVQENSSLRSSLPRLRLVEDRLCRGAKRQNERILQE